MMEPENLRAFIAVTENGSFSRASEKLFISQSAVSKRISSLEQGLDCRLFDRIGHTITLTEAGEVLLPRAYRILQEIEDSQRMVSNLAGTVGGTLRIGTSHHIGLHHMPPVLRDFTRYYSEVALDIQFVDSEQACNLVEQGKLELGIVTLPLLPSDNLKQIPIWHDPLEIVVGHDHALAKNPAVKLAELGQHHALLPATGTFTREVLEQALLPRGVTIKQGLSANYLETIKMLATVGLGWSVLPRTMIDDDLQVLHFKEINMERTLGIVCHTARTLSNAAQALIQTLEKYSSLA